MRTSIRSFVRAAAAALMLAVVPTAIAAAATSDAHVHANQATAVPQAIHAAGPSPVALGTAGSFAILAQSGITTTGATSVVGDIGVSPIDSTAMTGFNLQLDSTGRFATSSLVSGKAYAANYMPATPTKMTTAIGDMNTAYADAAGRTNPTGTELGAGNIDGLTIGPGLYKWSTGVSIPTRVTLSGGPNSVWIFQVSGTLVVGPGAVVALKGGALPQNIFWQTTGQTTLGGGSDFNGNILSKTAIVMKGGAKLHGRALAQTAVTMIDNAVTQPANATKLAITGRGYQSPPSPGQPKAPRTMVQFHWTVVSGTQPSGFNILGRTQHGKIVKMNGALVTRHASSQYTLTVHGLLADIDSFTVEAKVGSSFTSFGQFRVRG